MNWIKKPFYENDSFLFQINSNEIKKISSYDNYTIEKIYAFKQKDISKDRFIKFKNIKPSLKNIENIKDLRGSIYTYTVESKNDMDYENIIKYIKNNLKKENRRLLIRVNNSFKEYNENKIDVSCLSLIHYMPEKIRIIFRASDMTNELKTDLITIFLFFIAPIYKTNIIIEIYASTAQNIKEDFLNE